MFVFQGLNSLLMYLLSSWPPQATQDPQADYLFFPTGSVFRQLFFRLLLMEKFLIHDLQISLYLCSDLPYGFCLYEKAVAGGRCCDSCGETGVILLVEYSNIINHRCRVKSDLVV